MSEKSFRAVNKAVPKTDAFAIMGGAPVYTDDLVPAGALIVKLLRSPHALARIKSIDKSRAEKLPGVACVLTWQDVPHHRHTYAGSNYPGNNPFDRCILENIVRYVGDPVAIVAAEEASIAEKALKLIKVEYEVLTPVLDPLTADDGCREMVHPEDDYFFQMDLGGDLTRNVIMRSEEGDGDFDRVYAQCPVQLDETYTTCQNQQAMMETFRAFSYLDASGRLTLVDSTQVPFHVRRLVAMAMGIPQSKVRVIKPRIGGGFGAKQSLVCEMYPSAVTLKTGRPAYICFTRQEAFACANTRHAFQIRVRLGADEEGTVKALWVDSLENAGAYCEHAVNVIGLSAHKTLPLYGKAAWRYTAKVVYTNTTPGGAFRGFGATQGCYAVESTVNKMAARLKLDPAEVRLKNLPEVGKPMSAYYGETLCSCSLDRCIATGKRMIGWDEKYTAAPFARKVGPNRYRGLGMAICMQGSGLPNIDNCTVSIRLDDSGFYTLSIGATDMGTGCDTILAQMAAEVLECDPEIITVAGVDTLTSPYDKGSYASSSTYVTGNATVLAARELLGKMRQAAAEMLGVPAEGLEFDGERFFDETHSLSLTTLGIESVNDHNNWLTATASYCSKTTPPPFVAGFAEVEVDTATGDVKVCDLVGVVDCGTVINKALARVQAEGGFAQGVGMALYEDAVTGKEGRLYTDSFLEYKIPSRLDLPPIRIAFEESYEPTGPFGAKSIGEVVINTPTPAILSAIRNAVGVEIHSLPATAEKVFLALNANK